MTSRVVCVVGGSRGIGYAVAQRFHLVGYRTTIISKNPLSIQKALERLRQNSSEGGSSVSGYSCDVCNLSEAVDVIKLTETEVGLIDVLVNSAGVNLNKLLVQTSEEEIERVLQTNVIGSINTCKAVVKHMMKRKRGSIINIGSVVGYRGNGGQSVYAASKSALSGFTKSLAKEAASRGIRANLIVPGLIKTDMTSEGVSDAVLQHIPMGRIGSANEVAEAVFFLANSPYMTGQEVFVDGGLQLRM